MKRFWLVLCVFGLACGGRPPQAEPSCALAATGAFTFHVHNAGAAALLLDLGCGGTSPLELETPDGTLGAGPGNADVCELSCDMVYAGQATPGACSDCGGGVQRSIAAGATGDVAWDRRVYQARAVEPACSAKTGTCAFGIAVAATADQRGTITTCPADQRPTGSCLQPVVTRFAVDTTGAEATIDVN